MFKLIKEVSGVTANELLIALVIFGLLVLGAGLLTGCASMQKLDETLEKTVQAVELTCATVHDVVPTLQQIAATACWALIVPENVCTEAQIGYNDSLEVINGICNAVGEPAGLETWEIR